jgi:hypothetical protein
MEEVYQVSSVPVTGIWCAYKLAPIYPFFPSFNVSEAKHGQNSVKILSTERGKFIQKGTVSRRINPKDLLNSHPIEVDILYAYRIKFQLEDGTIQTVYTNDDDAGCLLLLMSAQENIDKFHDLAIRGHWQAAMTVLRGELLVEKSYISMADKENLEALAKLADNKVD